MSELVSWLLKTPLGKRLGQAEVEELTAVASQRTVPAGRYLFRVGEAGYTLYVVLRGGFDVVLGRGAEETVVAKVGPGQVLGELELMTQTVRVASLRAHTDSEVLELSGTRFDDMLAKNRPAATKLLYAVAQTLARRLAAVNRRVTELAPPSAPVPAAKASNQVELDVLDKIWS